MCGDWIFIYHVKCESVMLISLPQTERIRDLSLFIFGSKTGEQKRFYRYIAKDIQRPLFAVYRKMLRVFDVNNHVGRWSRENEEKLLRSVTFESG